jgi:hypothetical protein
MPFTFTNSPPIKLRPFSDDDSATVVDRSAGTCTCKSFLFGSEGHCRHLDELGAYKQKPFTPRTHPTFSQGLSALVKSIRMRRVEDAIYWLTYLDGFRVTDRQEQKAMRFRIARRILIGSAEDGMSIAVMENVASDFTALYKPETPLKCLAANILRICKLPNWWDSASGGHDYVRSALIGYRKHVLYRTATDADGVRELLQQALRARNRASALGALSLMPQVGIGSTKQAEFLLQMAREMRHEQAIRLLDIHLGARQALSSDNNFTGHAVWWLANGYSPLANEAVPVFPAEVDDLLEKAKKRWERPKPIPTFYCDGVHCAGNDRRYAGMLQDMYALCLCFSRYGNVHPENRWLPEFYPTDGLEVEPTAQSIAPEEDGDDPDGNTGGAPIQRS